VGLLKELIGETKYLQNRPPDLIPQEDLATKHILERLKPYTIENGGVLQVKHIHYVENRGNLIIKYISPKLQNSNNSKLPCVSFVGSHLDVVFADPKNWDRDPFKLTVEGDSLYGRGTTDCLGHCSLLTDIFIQLAEKKPDLKIAVIGVLIADEEVGTGKVGVEQLLEHKELDELAFGPLFWLDCADKQPNIGTGGVVQWELIITGKLFHSGFPHKAINAFEVANDSLRFIQQQFYKNFPRHEQEIRYGFPCSSSFKATQCFVPHGSINQIPGLCTIKGDIRLTPFYKIKDAMKVIDEAVQKIIDSKFKIIDDPLVRGPHSKSSIGNDLTAKIQLNWLTPPVNGLACNLESPGFIALSNATKKIIGHVQTTADTGSLPLVADLQENGFDVQTIGYGIEDAYHADNEFAKISDFEEGFKVLVDVIIQINNNNK